MHLLLNADVETDDGKGGIVQASYIANSVRNFPVVPCESIDDLEIRWLWVSKFSSAFIWVSVFRKFSRLEASSNNSVREYIENRASYCLVTVANANPDIQLGMLRPVNLLMT